VPKKSKNIIKCKQKVNNYDTDVTLFSDYLTHLLEKQFYAQYAYIYSIEMKYHFIMRSI